MVRGVAEKGSLRRERAFGEVTAKGESSCSVFGEVIAFDKTGDGGFKGIPPKGRKEESPMFVNCYDGYGLCLFSVTVKEGVGARTLGRHISSTHRLIDHWSVTDSPEGAVVRY